jgi:hypothetical protein
MTGVRARAGPGPGAGEKQIARVTYFTHTNRFDGL